MKKRFRILRIWYFGKLPYAKRVKRWMNGRLYRELTTLTPHFYEGYLKKYGNADFMKSYLTFGQKEENKTGTSNE